MRRFTLLRVDLSEGRRRTRARRDQEEVRRRHAARDPHRLARRRDPGARRRADLRRALPRAARRRAPLPLRSRAVCVHPSPGDCRARSLDPEVEGEVRQQHAVVARRVVRGVVHRLAAQEVVVAEVQLAADAHERVQEVLVAEAVARRRSPCRRAGCWSRATTRARRFRARRRPRSRCGARGRSARCRACMCPDRDVDLRPEQDLDQRPAQAAAVHDLQEVHGEIEHQQLRARARSRSPGRASARRSRACSTSCPSRRMPPRVPGQAQVDHARLGDRAGAQAPRRSDRRADDRASLRHVGSPSSASMRALSNPSSSRPRTSMTGTRSVGIPILAALSASSRAASGSCSMSLSANGIFRAGQVLARGPAGAAPGGAVDRDHGRAPGRRGATARRRAAVDGGDRRGLHRLRGQRRRLAGRERGQRRGLERLARHRPRRRFPLAQHLVEVRDVDAPAAGRFLGRGRVEHPHQRARRLRDALRLVGGRERPLRLGVGEQPAPVLQHLDGGRRAARRRGRRLGRGPPAGGERQRRDDRARRSTLRMAS